MNGFQRFVAQLVDADEKLFDVAKDDRRLRAPAIRIGVMEFLFAEQHPALAQHFDDVAVGVENVFACEFRQAGFVREPAVIVHWREDRQIILSA